MIRRNSDRKGKRTVKGMEEVTNGSITLNREGKEDEGTIKE